MAVKQVERRMCDFCEEREASYSPCCLCHKDFCYEHGDSYTPGDRIHNRTKFDLCHGCAKDFAAKLAVVMEGLRAAFALAKGELVESEP